MEASMQRMMKYVSRIYRCSQIDHANFLNTYGLSAPHLSLLLAIKRHPHISQDELAKFTFVNKSTITRQIRVLEEQGYIQKETGDDRRIKTIILTEKGEALHPVLIEYLDEVNDDLTQDFSTEEYEQFLNYIEMITKRSNERIKRLDWKNLICE